MKKLLISMAILAFAVFAVAVTQTGNLIIGVMSEEGQILPGATVTVTSPSLMGARTQTTGANGKATFRNLPPGDYSVEVSMDGFQTFRQGGIEVRLSKTSKIDASLRLGQAREVIEVVGTGPIVDTSSNTVAQEFDFDNYINHQPTYRHYTSVAGLAGGVIAANNPNAGGGGIYGNLYMVDGTFSMDPRTHTWGNQFNVDTIADMNLMRAGATAEYGHAMGAIFNMITKSGSNEIAGIGRLELWRQNWNDVTENNPAITTDNTRAGTGTYLGQVWNASGGGPLYPDMLWWYVGYSRYDRDTGYNRRLNPMDDTALTPAIRTYYGHLFSAKGTLQLGEDFKLSAFYNEDPIDIYNVNSGREDYYTSRCQPSADQLQTQGGWNIAFSASYIMTEELFLEAGWTENRGDLTVVAQNADPDGRWTASQLTGPFFRSDDRYYWGSIPQTYISQRYADKVRGALNYLVQTDTLGDHDVKLGIEWLDLSSGVEPNYYPSGEYIQTGPVIGIGFDNAPWHTLFTIENWRPFAEVHTKTWTFFLQDSMQVMDALTLNIGIRTDIGAMYDNEETNIHDDGIFTALAPRVGFAYDLEGSAIRGSFGRYYDSYTTYLVENFKVFATPERWSSYSPADGVDGRNGWNTVPDASWTYGDPVPIHTIDPNLHPQYVDEFTLGFDYLLSDTMAISVSGIYRDFKDAVCYYDVDADGAQYWTNLNTPSHGATVRTYLGALVEFRKRPTEDNLFLNLSFTYQDIKGFTVGAVSTAFYQDAAHIDENADLYWGGCGGDIGSVVGDLNWFAKGQATYFFPNNWYLGLQFNWIQGTATSSYDWADGGAAYGSVVIFPNGRADMERLPDLLWCDIQFGIEQPIELPWDVPLWDDTILLGVYLDIFNIFSTEVATNQQRYIYSSRYGLETTWYTARNYELGFRIEI